MSWGAGRPFIRLLHLAGSLGPSHSIGKASSLVFYASHLAPVDVLLEKYEAKSSAIGEAGGKGVGWSV